MVHNILFVDDEDEILKTYKAIFNPKSEDLYQSILEKYELNDIETSEKNDTYANYLDKFTYYFSSSGIDAVNFIESNIHKIPISVAFIDMRMPNGLDGLETAKKIHEIDPRVEIVFVTAYSDYDISTIFEKIEKKEKYLLLRKPFDSDEILLLAINLTAKYEHLATEELLIQNVSHELNTPLASIKGFVDILAEESTNPEHISYIHMIQSSLDLILSHVYDLTHFKFKDTNEVKDLINLTQYVSELVDQFNEKNNISIIYTNEYYENNDVFVYMSKTNLDKLINAILVNAVKFSIDKIVKVRIHSCEKGAALSVGNKCHNLTNDQLNVLENRFYRVENKHHNTPGLGLGLSIVKDICDKNDIQFTRSFEDQVFTTKLCFMGKYK